MINPGDERTTTDGRVWVAEKAYKGCEGCDNRYKWGDENCIDTPCTTAGDCSCSVIWKLKKDSALTGTELQFTER